MCFGQVFICRQCHRREYILRTTCDHYPDSVRESSTHGIHAIRIGIPRCDSCTRRERFRQEIQDLREVESYPRLKRMVEWKDGARPYAGTDEELVRRYREQYRAGERLHPYVRGCHDTDIARIRHERSVVYPSRVRTILNVHGDDVELTSYAREGRNYILSLAKRFEECLRTQDEIDRTGRPLNADDLRFRLDTAEVQERRLTVATYALANNASSEDRNVNPFRFADWMNDMDWEAACDEEDADIVLRQEYSHYLAVLEATSSPENVREAQDALEAQHIRDEATFEFVPPDWVDGPSPTAFREWVANWANWVRIDVNCRDWWYNVIDAYRSYLTGFPPMILRVFNANRIIAAHDMRIGLVRREDSEPRPGSPPPPPLPPRI